MIWHDPELRWYLAGLLAFLAAASALTWGLRKRRDPSRTSPMYDNLTARVRAWWTMVAIFVAASAAGPGATVALFAGVSFCALREFLTLTPTRRADHRALFWALFVILPGQYAMVALELPFMTAIFIPVYAFLFLPIRQALAGDTNAYLERTAKIQWGLMVCVYFISSIPALLFLPLRHCEPAANAKLLLFLVTVTQCSDVFQYIWGKTLGRHALLPAISPRKTREGLLGGLAASALLGGGLWWLTPFGFGEAAAVAAGLAGMGFFGGVVMSAIKRDRGVKDFGDLLPGHGGMLDRIDGLCFAAPVFYHFVRFYYGA